MSVGISMSLGKKVPQLFTDKLWDCFRATISAWHAVGSSKKWLLCLPQSSHSSSGDGSTCLFKSIPVCFDWKWRCLLSSTDRCFPGPWFFCIFLAGVCSECQLWILKWSGTSKGHVSGIATGLCVLTGEISPENLVLSCPTSSWPVCGHFTEFSFGILKAHGWMTGQSKPSPRFTDGRLGASSCKRSFLTWANHLAQGRKHPWLSETCALCSRSAGWPWRQHSLRVFPCPPCEFNVLCIFLPSGCVGIRARKSRSSCSHKPKGPRFRQNLACA